MKKNSIWKNIVHLFISTVVSRLLNAAALIVLAQYLSAASYGRFSVALAFAMVLGYFTDIGLSNTVLREGSKKRADVDHLLSSYVKMRILLLLATFAGAYIVISLFYHEASLVKMMYYLIVPMVTGLAMQSIGITYFQLTEQMHHLGAIRIYSALLLVVLLTIGMLMHTSAFFISFLFGFSYFLAGVYSLWMVGKRVSFNFKKQIQRGLLTNIGSFIVSGLLIMLLPQLGPIVLENTIPLAAVGVFAVAYRIPSALYQVPGIVAGAFYPVLFRHYNHQQTDKHLELNILQVKLMSLVGMLTALPFYHLSDLAVSLLFGDKWAAAGDALKWLSLMLIFQGLSVALADGLTTKGLQGRRTGVQLVAVVSGIAFYYFLSSAYSVIGAVYAALLIEGILFIGCWLCNRERLIIMRKTFPIFVCLFGSTIVFTTLLFSQHPFIALCVNMLLVFLLTLLDKEIRNQALGYLQKNKPLNVENRKEAQNG
ncbi:oligosaccharide flippase family protein [Priestia megaterium]|uniref:oligosaccharide flippase family protein n=1 Tax=Priestia megaterium TaxID=1404 RepID=UPI00345ADBA2